MFWQIIVVIVVASLTFLPTLLAAMILYPRFHVIFDPLRVRFEMDAWRPSLRPRPRRAKPRR
jgi:hypothetical protein